MSTCAQLSCPPPHGRAECHCAACHLTFSGVSAFDLHQKLDGGLACLPPSSRGLVRYDRHGRTVWGWPERGGWIAERRRENAALGARGVT